MCGVREAASPILEHVGVRAPRSRGSSCPDCRPELCSACQLEPVLFNHCYIANYHKLVSYSTHSFRVLNLRERACARGWGRRGRISDSPAGQGALHRAQSHNPETMTGAKTERTLSRLSQPGVFTVSVVQKSRCHRQGLTAPHEAAGEVPAKRRSYGEARESAACLRVVMADP